MLRPYRSVLPAVDPTALSYLLAVTGPAYLPKGTVISAKNVVRLTQSTAYLTFGKRQAARKQFLLNVAKAAERRILEQPGNLPALLILASSAFSSAPTSMAKPVQYSQTINAIAAPSVPYVLLKFAKCRK